MSWIYLLFITTILLFFVAYIASGKDILSPSVTMSIMFVISTTFATLNASVWELHYSFEAYFITVTGILTFIFFQLLVQNGTHNHIVNQHRGNLEAIRVQHWKLLSLLLLDLVIVFWYFMEIREIMGAYENISMMFGAYRWKGIANLSGDGTEVVSGLINQFIKIVTSSGYVAGYILINNIVTKYKDRMTKVYLVLILLVSTFPGLMAGSRAFVIRIASALLIFFYIVIHQKRGWDKKLSWQFIRVGIVCLIGGILIFYYGMELIGRNHINTTLQSYISAYLGGGIALFSEYLKNQTPCTIPGEESLFGLVKVLRLLGIADIPISYNLEFRTTGTLTSNAYTFFRRPIHDFGLLGMYFFIAFVALFFAWIYYFKIKNKLHTKKTSHWIIIYGYLYYWMVSSSILQYSVGYVAIGTVIILIEALVIFEFLTNNKVIFRIAHKKP